MVRISLQEQYDNKDVIQQIKKIKEDLATVGDTADDALNKVINANTVSGQALTKADQAIATADSASAKTDALQVTVDGHTQSIQDVEIQVEQALTDANDAFDQASITQTAEAATITMTRGTGYQEQIPFPIASSVQTGMMNAQTYSGIVNLTARVDKLEASKTVFYVSFSSNSPSQSEITSVFTTASGRPPAAGDYATDIARDLTYGYNGSTWIKVETSADIPIFTVDTPGVIKGSTLDGTVAAETDGTGSVNGWDTVKTSISNNTESIGTINGQISTIQGSVSNMETEISGLNSNLNAKQNTITSVTITLTASGWSNSSQTVSASNVTASNIVWVSPAPASFDAYGKAGVRATAQADGSITFTCTKAPAKDLTVKVVA